MSFLCTAVTSCAVKFSDLSTSARGYYYTAQSSFRTRFRRTRGRSALQNPTPPSLRNKDRRRPPDKEDPSRWSEDRDRRRPPDEDFPPRRSDGRDKRRPLDKEYSLTRRSDDREMEPPRRVSASNSLSGTGNAQTATATGGVVIPTKSTIADEEIGIGDMGQNKSTISFQSAKLKAGAEADEEAFCAAILFWRTGEGLSKSLWLGCMVFTYELHSSL